MKPKNLMRVCALVAVSALAAPAAASALTKTVYADAPPSLKALAKKTAGKKFLAVRKDNPGLNTFFLNKVTINTGDTVKFLINGFHTIDLPGPTNKDLPLVVGGATVSGVNDAAGNPFWFNGKVPSLGLNPQVLSPIAGSSYNGSARIDTGLFLGNGNPPPLKVKFTKPGTYKYFCDVHPGMVGTVVVLAKGKKIPSAKQDTATLKKQETTDIKSLEKLASTKPAAGHVDVGQTGTDGTELYSMFPAKLSVKAGTVVTFTVTKAERDTHTATFGPAAYLTGLSNGLFSSPGPTQESFYPSDNPQLGPIQLTGTSHGNAFANTGALDRDPTTPQPVSEKIKFTTPGTYHFICLIHAFMTGTVVVK